MRIALGTFHKQKVFLMYVKKARVLLKQIFENNFYCINDKYEGLCLNEWNNALSTDILL